MDNTYPNTRAPARLSLSREFARQTGAWSDAKLISASVRDPEQFTELFERHWDGLHRFCLNRAGEAGEDIAAETFRVAFDRRRRYDASYPSARPWLFGIATNLLRDHFRAARREERKLMRSAVLEPLQGDEGDLNALERQFLGPQLAAALQGIPAADRDALLLMAWADMGYEQIAQALDIPLGTVRSRIHRARQRVREHLDAAGGETNDTLN